MFRVVKSVLLEFEMCFRVFCQSLTCVWGVQECLVRVWSVFRVVQSVLSEFDVCLGCLRVIC